jgi:hypothetical protein
LRSSIQPIRIGDLGAEVVVDDVALTRLRVLQRRLRQERRFEKSEDQAVRATRELKFMSDLRFYLISSLPVPADDVASSADVNTA